MPKEDGRNDDDWRPLEPWEEEPWHPLDEPPPPANDPLATGSDAHPLPAALVQSEAAEKLGLKPERAMAPPTPGRPPLNVADDPVFTHVEVAEPRKPPPPPKPQGPLVLDDKQEFAIADCGRELYTNISGTAGVGKTLVAQQIVKQHPGTVLAATTGIASVNLGEGTTINALLKYFDTPSLLDAFEHGALQARINSLRRAGVRRILIDEKSMMSGEQLTMINRAVRECNEGGVYALEDVGAGGGDVGDEDDSGKGKRRNKDLPPLGITLVGDFGQLPPVPDEDPKTGKKKPIQYAFDSKEWPLYAEHTTTLTTIYRQDAQDFIAALHAVRKADVQAAVNFFTAPKFERAIDQDFNGTTIFAKNISVDRHNMLMLDKLVGAPLAVTAWHDRKQRGDWKQIPETLRLKEGALVMILANKRDYMDEHDTLGTIRYANGDLGILLGADEGTGDWYVTLHRTGETVRVEPVTRENTIPLEVGRRKAMKEAFEADPPEGAAPMSLITDDGKGRMEIVGKISYMPLRAAYGCTVHKTQGLTLDNVQVNIRDWMFKTPGMLFVALSRARTAEGLRIVGDQRGFIERCRIEPRVQPWL